MHRGNSCGGGQSSLGYLFGGGEAPAPAPAPAAAPAPSPAPAPALAPVAAEGSNETPPKPAPAGQHAGITAQIPAGINRTSVNNYVRTDGQNTGNFLTDRPSTKVHAAPGGGSSLDYLFSGSK